MAITTLVQPRKVRRAVHQIGQVEVATTLLQEVLLQTLVQALGEVVHHHQAVVELQEVLVAGAAEVAVDQGNISF